MSRHLIHIGFPKAGSTALGAWFEAHPQLAYVPNGLGGFYHAFDVAAEAAREVAAGGGAVAGGRVWHVTSGEALSSPRVSDAPTLEDPAGLATVVPQARPRVCATLRRLFPTATILVVTRGFEGALRSTYSQYVRGGGRLTWPELLGAPGLRSWLDYDGTIALYREAFGDRVIVLPYELLRDDPRRFTGELEDRLGLEPGGPAIPALNPSLSPAAIHWYRRLSRIVAAVARPLGPRAGGRLYAAYVWQVHNDRLRRPAALLGGRAPELPAGAVESFRGAASSLAGEPLYAPYARDYLNDAPPA